MKNASTEKLEEIDLLFREGREQAALHIDGDMRNVYDRMPHLLYWAAQRVRELEALLSERSSVFRDPVLLRSPRRFTTKKETRSPSQRERMNAALSKIPDLSNVASELETVLELAQNRPPEGAADGTIDEATWYRLRAISWALSDLVRKLDEAR